MSRRRPAPAAVFLLALAVTWLAVACATAAPAAGGEGAMAVHFVAAEGGEAEVGRPVGDPFGCGDRLVAVDAGEAAAEGDPEARIAAALAAQFAARGEPPEGLYDALARSSLRVEAVDPVPATPGVYRVKLGGNLRLGGVCDAPRIRHQLEATATQFEDVEEVEIFLGEQPLEAVLAARQ